MEEKKYILVEGTTDKEVLDFCIEQFFPSCLKVLEIIPFDNPNRPGGTSHATDFMKIIHNATSDMKAHNSYLALFDNDTEGVRCKDIFHALSRVKVSVYPDCKDFKRYPTYSTLKKGSIVKDDINGRAASIELYLPDFLIKDEIGNFYPIRWHSYEGSVGKYQGGLEKTIKGKVMDKFRDYRCDVKKGLKELKKEEWKKCISIIEMVIDIFR